MISMVGSSLVGYVITWHVAIVTNSGMQVAIMISCMFVPQLLISFFAGVWADRYSRKMLIILADAFIATVTLVVAIFYHMGHEQLSLLYVAAAARSLGSGIQSPAVSAAIPQIAPTDQLMRVNSLNSTVMSLVTLATPAMAAFVLTLGKLSYVMMIDVVTAVIGIAVLSFMPLPPLATDKTESARSALHDLAQGFRYALGHRFIKKLLLLFIVFSILIVPAAMLNTLFVRRVFGEDNFYLMWNEISFSLGMIVGGFLISVWGGFRNRLTTLLVGCIFFGAMTFAIGYSNVFWVYLILIGLMGLSAPLFNSPVMVLLQEKVEPSMQGRVFSLIGMVSAGVMPLGSFVFGPMADIIDIRTMVIASGALIALLSFASLFDRGFMAEGLPLTNDESK